MSKEIIIDGPGEYILRNGQTVTINKKGEISHVQEHPSGGEHWIGYLNTKWPERIWFSNGYSSYSYEKQPTDIIAKVVSGIVLRCGNRYMADI